MKAKVSLSVVIPVYRGAQTIGRLVDELAATLKKYRLEIVLINDASPDNSHQICLNLAKKYSQRIKYLQLARNFGEHNAVMAGLNHATGDYAVIIDDDFQNPPSEIEKLVNRAIAAQLDVVYSYYTKKKHSWFRNFGSRFNNLIASVLLNKPRNFYLSSFKCLNRFTINQVIKYSGPYPYIDGLIWRSTRKIGKVLVKHVRRTEGKSGYTLRKLTHLWLNMFVNFSIYPLRVSTFLGVLFSFLGAALAVFFTIDKILHPEIPIGITTILIAILIFAGVQLLMLGLIGEYVGKLFLTTNLSPQYVIRHFYQKGKKISDPFSAQN